MFSTLMLYQESKTTVAHVAQIDESQLPDGDTLVAVDYSSINYKDGLAITGKGRIIRDFPMIPGIDFAGRIIETSSDAYNVGDSVVLTGWGVGETRGGGLAEKARLDANLLVPLPEGLSASQSMIIGTAGLTAMLCVDALIEGGIKPESGKILVTGASGGVGSTAITLLHALGYEVTACSGRIAQNTAHLTQLGATELIERSELEEAAKPLEKQRWAGVIDTVGDKVLAKAIAQTHYNGVVACCGLAGGFGLPTTVMPFILRNVRLQGIDSVMCPIEKRTTAWKQLTELLPQSFYEQASETIELKQVPEYADRITKGDVTGRVIVKL
ncbi:quinone oxidoreductase [Oleiphilus sp. HI0125]|uniref:MDR family oxidoreductase n=2 Tax=Oleiphilus sp. HI0125 TaxID=1822266 RepID=UPI0007C36DCF|nr:MDR family oxidoreductase [Oleiphilus sp. HI0125]KZZ62640.1 quinone oxidoreductase [Oleiphilus sp. HI0125]